MTESRLLWEWAETGSGDGAFRPRPGTQWHLAEDYEAMSRAACAWLVAEVGRKPDSLVCLATGASPRRTYELRAARGQADRDLCGRVRWLKLDEWGGLEMDDPATCEMYLRRTLLEPLHVPSARFIAWHSQPAEPEAECRRMAVWLAAHGPVDLAVLGLGENGHLGFNEPADVLQAGPHVARLSASSLGHSMLGESRNRVRYGLTLGMDDILHSRKILLLVCGERNAQFLQWLVCKPPSPQFPASMLQRHADVTVYCDRAAAALLLEKISPAVPGPAASD